jgi:phage gpG-like protein
MSLSISIATDTLTPSLRSGLSASRDMRPVWMAALTQIVSITKRSFTDSTMRIASWASKRSFTKNTDGTFSVGDGGPSKLIFKGTLLSSIRVVEVSTSGGSVGSDRVYAAIHQMGGIIRPKQARQLVFSVGGVKIRAKKVTIPARPFFPFTPDGRIAPQHEGSVLRVIDLAMKKRLGIP